MGIMPEKKDELGRVYYEGKYKYGKPKEEISLGDLKRAVEHGEFKKPLLHKSYLVFIYWIGARRNEPIPNPDKNYPGVLKEDVEVRGESLFIKNLPAFKRGERAEEIEIPLSRYGVNLIVERWKKTWRGKPLWPFSTSTAYRIIKRIWPEKTPHHLRYNRVTKMRKLRDRKKIFTDDIKSVTGIKSDATIQRYGLRTKEGAHRVAVVMDE